MANQRLRWPLIVLAAASASCASAGGKHTKDDCHEMTMGALRFDCENFTFELKEFCFMLNNLPGCPKIKAGTVRIGGDTNGDGKLQDGEVVTTLKATPGSATWYFTNVSGTIPSSSRSGLIHTYIQGDNGTVYMDDTDEAKA